MFSPRCLCVCQAESTLTISNTFCEKMLKKQEEKIDNTVAHTFKHTSPGGTTRTDQYILPAAGRATGDERCAWRLRIVRSRREARGLVARYWTQCSKCHRKQHIMPDGRMFPHSLRETVPSKERALYKSEHRQSSDVWRCPGSHEYHGHECS